ncbi:MAG: transaldolase [Pseudomonadota bacterium]
MTGNPLLTLQALGQSVWQDDLRRRWLSDGTIARLIAEDGLSGITSNPTTFHAAIAEHEDYDEDIRRLVRAGRPPEAVYQELTVADVAAAADLFRPCYDATGGADGFVSLEVSPHLARDLEGTLAEARRLWRALGRPNVMIKVPATAEGVRALRRLVAEGINVNATLLFSVERYREIAQAHLEALDERARAGQPVDRVASVASFFLSRIDTLVDAQLDAAARADPAAAEAARSLRGGAAIAQARLAYQAYRRLVREPRWTDLAARGARPQRLLWASTGTKDPAYGDVYYVEPLIGAETVTTLKPETLAAYRDHGNPARRLEEGLDAARALPHRLAAAGIDLEAAASRLEAEGIEKFVEPYDRTLALLRAS